MWNTNLCLQRMVQHGMFQLITFYIVLSFVFFVLRSGSCLHVWSFTKVQSTPVITRCSGPSQLPCYNKILLYWTHRLARLKLGLGELPRSNEILYLCSFNRSGLYKRWKHLNYMYSNSNKMKQCWELSFSDVQLTDK